MSLPRYVYGQFSKLQESIGRVGTLEDLHRAIGLLPGWEKFLKKWGSGGDPSGPVYVLFFHNANPDVDALKRDLLLSDIFHSEKCHQDFPEVLPTVFVFDSQYFLEYVKHHGNWELKLPDLAMWMDFVYEPKDQHLAANDAYVTLIVAIALALYGDMINAPGEDPDERFEEVATMAAQECRWENPYEDIPINECPKDWSWQRPGESLMHQHEKMTDPYTRPTYLLAIDLEHNDHKAQPWQCRRELRCRGVCHRHEITELGVAGILMNDLWGISPGLNGRRWRDRIWTRTFRVSDVPTNGEAPGKDKPKQRHNLNKVFNQQVQGSRIQIVKKAELRGLFVDLLKELKSRHPPAVANLPAVDTVGGPAAVDSASSASAPVAESIPRTPTVDTVGVDSASSASAPVTKSVPQPPTVDTVGISPVSKTPVSTSASSQPNVITPTTRLLPTATPPPMARSVALPPGDLTEFLQRARRGCYGTAPAGPSRSAAVSAVGVTTPQRTAIDTTGVREEVEENDDEEEEDPAVDTAGPALLIGDMAWRNGHKNLLALEECISEGEYKWAMSKTCGDTLKGHGCETEAYCVRIRDTIFACKDVKPRKHCDKPFKHIGKTYTFEGNPRGSLTLYLMQVHILPTCLYLLNKRECERQRLPDGCPFGHDFPEIRLAVEEKRQWLKRCNTQRQELMKGKPGMNLSLKDMYMKDMI